MSRPTPELPPLVLIVSDIIAIEGVPAEAVAFLHAPGVPLADLEGMELFRRIEPNNGIEATRTDRSGQARFRLPPMDQNGAIHVFFVGPRDTYRRDDLGRVFVMKHDKTTPIAVDELVVDGVAVNWESATSDDIVLKKDAVDKLVDRAKAGFTPVYLAGDRSALAYRNMRAWLRDATATKVLPEGPLAFGTK